MDENTSFITPQNLETDIKDKKIPANFEAGDAEHPLAVTQVYSSYGLEYIIMLISLAVTAVGLGSMLDAVIDLAGSKSASLVGALLNPYAEAALIVSLPIFILLFLRLEAREESDSTLLADASRRRGIQVTLIISFLVFISQLIGYIGGLLSSGSDSYQGAVNLLSTAPTGGSAVVQLLHALVGLVISGGIFGYYWVKLHKKSGLQ